MNNQSSVIGEQSSVLLKKSEALLVEAENFIEAVRRSKRLQQRERLAAELEMRLQRAFRQQGRKFMQYFREYLRGFFKEGFEGHSAFLNAPLKESISATDWLIVWLRTAQDTSKLFSAPIDQVVEAALKAGAADAIGEMVVKISFDLENPAAVSYLEDYGAKLVSGVNETTRKYLQTVIQQAVEEGWSYDKTADAITSRFEQFAIGAPQAHIDSRAHAIAVTETGNAYAEGNLQAAKQLQAAGIPMEKFWSTVGDEKVSETICAPNEQQGWIPLSDAFQSGHQRPLGHPVCRCDLLTRMKE